MSEESKNYPIPYKIYKGAGGKQGCFQFKLVPAYSSQRKDEGCILIEAANATGPNVYDWENKIIFALAVNDLGLILSGIKQGKFDIYHDPDAQTETRGTRAKTLSLEKGQKEGTYFLRVTEKNQTNNKSVHISLQPNEMSILVQLFQSAIPALLAWK